MIHDQKNNYEIRLRTFVFILLIQFGTNQSIVAQDLAICDTNVYWIIPIDNKSFISLTSPGKFLQLTNQPNIIIADKTYPIQYILTESKPYQENGMNTLSRYSFFLAANHSDVLGEKLNVQTQAITLSNNLTSFFWFYSMPKNDKEIAATLFISMEINDKIFTISTVQYQNNAFDVCRMLLISKLKEIQIHNGKYSLKRFCRNTL